MATEIQSHYDVVIMGGGPSGATLGALLARETSLRVAIFEQEVFPRDHIGESFAHPLVPVLERSGALPKVLASDCWIQKYGGVFNWDSTGPSVAFFEHHDFVKDGVYRWSMHVNRAEFDQVLLDHAAESGVDVFEGTRITLVEPNRTGCMVTVEGERRVRAGFFVDASGRRNNVMPGEGRRKHRSWLSSYRNIAVWSYYLNCRPTQSLPGDWNIFREPNLSPIGCFAHPDGWCWFIPTPVDVDGERRIAHSIGLVTNPEVLREPGKDYTDPEVFLRLVKRVPMLRDLVQDAEPIRDRMLTATNYSMISDRFADFDERWLAIGDASYFVDPLFSSGVSFAVTQAWAAALLLATTVDGTVSEQAKRDMWRDYDVGWRGMAETFALAIDQWYYAIGKNNPGSVYWRSRGSNVDLEIREQTFQALLNTALVPDLIQVMTGGTGRLDPSGPYMSAYTMADPGEPDPDAVLDLADGVEMRESLALDVPGFKGLTPPPPFELPDDVRANIARYWEDPVANHELAPAPLDTAVPCHRFVSPYRPDGVQVRAIVGRDGGAELWALLAGGPVAYRDLRDALSAPQRALLKQLVRAGMVRVDATSPTPVG